MTNSDLSKSGGKSSPDQQLKPSERNDFTENIEDSQRNENQIETLKQITRSTLPTPSLERLPSSFELPLPASREELLDNLEGIKEQYRLQEKTWNHLLTSSRQAADEKLKRMLDQYK